MELNETQVQKAVCALTEYVNKKSKSTTELLDDGSNIIKLQFGLKKIPSARNKIIKVSLPHPLVTKTTDVCLFVKDLAKKGSDPTETVDHFTELLQQHKVKMISEVIPLKTLKTEYKPYEAKKNLSNMFDVYLADERIIRLIPAFLGKNFYKRKRYPIQVNMRAKDLKKEITKVLGMTQCVISGRGSTCQVTVGKTDQDADKVVENTMAVVNKLLAVLPGGPENVKNMHLKTQDSPSLAIYWSSDSAENVELPDKKRKYVLDEPEDVTTVMNGKVRVTPYGSVHVINEETEKYYNKKGQLKPTAKKLLKKKHEKRVADRKMGKKATNTKDEADKVQETVEPPSKKVKRDDLKSESEMSEEKPKKVKREAPKSKSKISEQIPKKVKREAPKSKSKVSEEKPTKEITSSKQTVVKQKGKVGGKKTLEKKTKSKPRSMKKVSTKKMAKSKS